MHLDGEGALERVNRLKFFLSGALVFPDQPLIRIPQKTLDILLPLTATRIKKIVVSPAVLPFFDICGSVAGACLHATRAEQPPAGKTALKSKSQASVRIPRKSH
jgi:hypothetical protein